jgi:hypothetical protein
VFCVGLWRGVDLGSSSTASLAYIFIPLWGIAGLAVVWSLVGFAIERGKKKHKQRFANPS